MVCICEFAFKKVGSDSETMETKKLTYKYTRVKEGKSQYIKRKKQKNVKNAQKKKENISIYYDLKK